MILKMNRKSKGRKGVVEYLLNQREKEGTAITLRGNHEITKSLIKAINRKHKYLSGGLMFAKEEHIDENQKHQIMDAFEAILFTGLELNQYNILWVEHIDKGRLELNFVVPRIELTTGIDLDLYSHKRDLPIFDTWKNGINAKYNLADPNDPSRARTISERTKVSRGKGTIVANRKNLDETLHKLVSELHVKNREQMIELLENSGYKITRKNAESISVKHNDIGKKALRLKGGIYSENFTSTGSIESIIKNREQRAREYHTRATQTETGTHRAIYKKYLQTRNERHKKRYCKARRSDKKEPQIIKERNPNNLDSEANTQDEKINIDDRIREFIETSDSKRAKYFERARKREAKLLEQIRNSSIKLSKSSRESEQKLLESLTNTRSNVEGNITKNTKQVLQNIIRENSKDRSSTIRVHELLTELKNRFSSIKKSIEGAINGIKKLKIFKSAKKEMMSEKGPTITLSPRR
jgi:hypothetical protein